MEGYYSNTMKTTYIKSLNSMNTHKYRSQEKLSIKKDVDNL